LYGAEKRRALITIMRGIERIGKHSLVKRIMDRKKVWQIEETWKEEMERIKQMETKLHETGAISLLRGMASGRCHTREVVGTRQEARRGSGSIGARLGLNPRRYRWTSTTRYQYDFEMVTVGFISTSVDVGGNGESPEKYGDGLFGVEFSFDFPRGLLSPYDGGVCSTVRIYHGTDGKLRVNGVEAENDNLGEVVERAMENPLRARY